MTDGNLERVTEFGPDGSTARIYDDWAASYDDDLEGQYGYNAPQTAVLALAGMTSDRSGAVIDYGCGTGLAAAQLAHHGWSVVDGADISEGMLDVARAKALYRNLIQADLTKPIDIADSAYDVLLCVGSMGNGHLEPEHLPEMLRTVKHGAPVVFYLNAKPYLENGYESAFRALEEAGHWVVDRIEETNYMSALDRPGRLIVAHRSDLSG